jgi:hypothetical protein
MANLQAHVVNRLSPRKSPSLRRIDMSASSALCHARSSRSAPPRCGNAARQRPISNRAARSSSSCSSAAAASRSAPELSRVTRVCDTMSGETAMPAPGNSVVTIPAKRCSPHKASTPRAAATALAALHRAPDPAASLTALLVPTRTAQHTRRKRDRVRRTPALTERPRLARLARLARDPAVGITPPHE